VRPLREESDYGREIGRDSKSNGQAPEIWLRMTFLVGSHSKKSETHCNTLSTLHAHTRDKRAVGPQHEDSYCESESGRDSLARATVTAPKIWLRMFFVCE